MIFCSQISIMAMGEDEAHKDKTVVSSTKKDKFKLTDYGDDGYFLEKGKTKWSLAVIEGNVEIGKMVQFCPGLNKLERNMTNEERLFIVAKAIELGAVFSSKKKSKCNIL